MRRLYVSRPKGVTTVDVDSGKITGKFADCDGVHGILKVPGTQMIISANEGTNAAMLFNEATGRILASGDATLVDVKKPEAAGTIPMGGQRLEFSVTDDQGLVYVNADGVDNVEDKSEIAVLDIAGQKVARRIALPGCARPSGFA